MQKITSINRISNLVQNGDTVMVGGFGLVGSPLYLIQELVKANVKDLVIISNNLGEQGQGLGELVVNKQIKKVIGSFFTSNKDVVESYKNQDILVELLPQGTLAEAIRAGGAGIAGFYVPASVGTRLGENKEEKEIDGINYVLESPLVADIALIKADKADKLGNLTYLKSSRNFNSVMATSAKTVIVEVDKIIEIGELPAEEIVTPHLYVDYIISKEEKEN